jgi:hypothetical protein
MRARSIGAICTVNQQVDIRGAAVWKAQSAMVRVFHRR